MPHQDKETQAHRERFIQALNHQEGDRVPIAFGGPECSVHKLAHRRLLEYLGMEVSEDAPIQDSILQIVSPDERLYSRFDVDAVWVTPGELAAVWSENRETFVDELSRSFDFGGGFYNQVGFPLKEGTQQELDLLEFPNMSDPWRVAGLAQKAQRLYDQGFGLVADGPWGIYEISSSLRGNVALFTDLVENQIYTEALAERVLEEHLKPFYESTLKEVGNLVQMVVVSDDLGSQENLLFSPRIFRNVYKPRLKKLVEHIRKFTSARVYLHSDGAVAELIPDFIDAGLDGLNPVQYTAKGMDSDKLKTSFGKYFGFFGGGIENQILSAGDPDQIYEEVRCQMILLGPGGGYVFSTIHNISPEVPAENIIAFFEAGIKYGMYHSNH